MDPTFLDWNFAIISCRRGFNLCFNEGPCEFLNEVDGPHKYSTWPFTGVFLVTRIIHLGLRKDA